MYVIKCIKRVNIDGSNVWSDIVNKEVKSEDEARVRGQRDRYWAHSVLYRIRFIAW